MTISNAPDYYRNASNFIYTEEGRKEVFSFFTRDLNRRLNSKEEDDISIWLDEERYYLDKIKEGSRKDESVYQMSVKWYQENLDLIKEICKRSNDPFSRKSSIYLLIKFLPSLGRGHDKKVPILDLIDVYLFILHTLRYFERYTTDEYKLAQNLAIRGLFRWDAKWLIEKFLREDYQIEYIKSIDDEDKKPYNEILDKEVEVYDLLKDIKISRFQDDKIKREDSYERLMKNDEQIYESILFLFFTNSFDIIRFQLFKDRGNDVIFKGFINNKEKIKRVFDNEVENWISNPEERIIGEEIWLLLESRLSEELKKVEVETKVLSVSMDAILIDDNVLIKKDRS